MLLTSSPAWKRSWECPRRAVFLAYQGLTLAEVRRALQPFICEACRLEPIWVPSVRKCYLCLRNELLARFRAHSEVSTVSIGPTSAIGSARPYDRSDYTRWQTTARSSAAAIVPEVMSIVQPRSVVDVGCGSGAWAAEFIARGVADVLAIDGAYVDRDVLAIPSRHFLRCDLTEDFAAAAGRRFHLALCLEVAEHLPVAAGDALIRRLAFLADRVLFSAAIPGQGGRNHVNEQWPSYWDSRFREVGLVPSDVIRPRFWNRHDIAVWYRQNMFLYTPAGDRVRFEEHVRPLPSDIVHPELWNRAQRQIARLQAPITVRRSVRLTVKAVGRSLRRRLLRD